jgi:hypothetical protein
MLQEEYEIGSWKRFRRKHEMDIIGGSFRQDMKLDIIGGMLQVEI